MLFDTGAHMHMRDPTDSPRFPLLERKLESGPGLLSAHWAILMAPLVQRRTGVIQEEDGAGPVDEQQIDVVQTRGCQQGIDAASTRENPAIDCYEAQKGPESHR